MVCKAGTAAPAKCDVFVHPHAAAAPGPIRGAQRAKSATFGRFAQGVNFQLGCCKRLEWHKLGWSGDGGQDEPIQVVQNGAREEFTKRADVTAIGAVQR